MNALAYSRGYMVGMARGYRLAGRSLLRRLFVILLVGAVLWGAAIALGWEFADRLAKLETGQPVAVIVLSKMQSWFRVHPPRR